MLPFFSPRCPTLLTGRRKSLKKLLYDCDVYIRIPVYISDIERKRLDKTWLIDIIAILCGQKTTSDVLAAELSI